MALTNEEKSYMRSEIKAYIRDGVTKKEAKDDLMQEGFNSRTIDKYWKAMANVKREVSQEKDPHD